MSNKSSKHAFGSEANIDYALQQGLIDNYDVLFLDEGKIGWIDKNGNKVILEDKVQVALVNELPQIGLSDIIYIYNGDIYLWDGVKFMSPVRENGGLSEDIVDSKIESAKQEVLDAAKAYADEQLAAADSDGIVEF